MTGRKSVMSHIIVWMTIAAVAAVLGCAGKKAAMKTDDGVMLRYQAPEGKALTYEKSETSTQSMKMMGQAMDTSTNKTMTFKVEPKGTETNLHTLTITIEEMEAGMETPQGKFTADVEPVIGETFDMMLSVLGRESGMEAADGVEYNMGMAGTRSVRPDFEAFFPNLPEMRVKIWDSWPSTDTLNIADSGMDVRIIAENLNVLDGFETISGRECAKVTAEVTGTITGEGMQGGANLAFEGEMTGKEIWYFDYEAGVFVQSSSDLSVIATVNVTGPQDMTIPVSQTITMTANLVE
jgi:hypothetical protein